MARQRQVQGGRHLLLDSRKQHALAACKREGQKGDCAYELAEEAHDTATGSCWECIEDPSEDKLEGVDTRKRGWPHVDVHCGGRIMGSILDAGLGLILESVFQGSVMMRVWR